MAFAQVVTFLLPLVAAAEVGLQAAADAQKQQRGPAALCAHGECIFSGTAIAGPAPPPEVPATSIPAADLPPAAPDLRELAYPVPSHDVLVRQPLEHTYEDCFEPCGGAGFCPRFCGAGNACCRHSGDDVVPAECKAPISPFRTWHYECVQAKPDMSLGSFEGAVALGQAVELPKGIIAIIALAASAAILRGLALQYRLAHHEVAQERRDASSSYSQLELSKSLSSDLESANASQAGEAGGSLTNPAAGYRQPVQLAFAHAAGFAPTLLRAVPAGAVGGK